jgi:hypothetical protein
VPSGSRILLKFIDLETEYCDDFVQVYDGMNGNVSMGLFCGSTKPRNLISTSNFMTIKFTSDISGNYRGFYVYYAVINQSMFFKILVFFIFLKIESIILVYFA